MNTNLIRELRQATLTGSLRFPEIAGKFIVEESFRLRGNVRQPMKRLVLGLTAFTLATAVVAGPAIGNLPKSDIDASQFCQFSINDAAGGVVLQMKYWEANIVLDSKLTKLRVEEKNCTTDCVGSGLSGVRVFQLSGSGIQAKLTKQVACAKDAEVCGGLPEGAAELRVSTSAGETVLTLWGEYCDM